MCNLLYVVYVFCERLISVAFSQALRSKVHYFCSNIPLSVDSYVIENVYQEVVTLALAYKVECAHRSYVAGERRAKMNQVRTRYPEDSATCQPYTTCVLVVEVTYLAATKLLVIDKVNGAHNLDLLTCTIITPDSMKWQYRAGRGLCGRRGRRNIHPHQK